MVYYRGLGRPAVATMCRPGEILTRDGCEPSGAEGYEAPRENCGPGTYWHDPTASCRPVDCPDGFALDSSGQCVPLERDPEPEPMEFQPVITDGDPQVDSTSITTTEPQDTGTVVDPGASGGGTGVGPTWGAPPEIVVQFGPEGPPSWWDDGGPAAPTSSGKGFGMLEAGLGALVAFLIGQSLTRRGRNR